MNINTGTVSDFHFAMPQQAPSVTMPINAIARYAPPVLPNSMATLVNRQQTARLPVQSFYNFANPGRRTITP